MTAAAPLVGVLALQGDVVEHLKVLARLGATGRAVRRPEELGALDGLIIPGGESTTIARLIEVFELRTPLIRALAAGLPAFGSCAGMIMLAQEILDGRPDQRPLGALDISVRRNAFGRQVDSFETDLEVVGLDGPLRAVFIRAPWIDRLGPQVEVLATVDGHPVAVRQGSVMATAFHPEIGGDSRMHSLFLDLIAGDEIG